MDVQSELDIFLVYGEKLSNMHLAKSKINNVNYKILEIGILIAKRRVYKSMHITKVLILFIN